MLFSLPSCIFLIIFIFSCYWKKIKYSAVCEFPNQLFSKIIILFWNKEYYFILMRFLLPFIQCHVYILALDLLLYFDCRLCLNEETSECVILIMLNVRATLSSWCSQVKPCLLWWRCGWRGLWREKVPISHLPF